MSKRILLFVCVLISIQSLYSQDKKALKFAKTITAEDMREHLTFIASDSLEGRNTGSRGQKIAAEYIKNHFESLGLEGPVEEGNGYFQTFELQRADIQEVYLKNGDDRKLNFEDFLYYTRNEVFPEREIEVVFGGYDEDALDGLDVKGKFVALVNKEWSNFRNTIAELKKKEAEGFFLIIEDEQQFSFVMKRYSGYLSGPKMDFELKQAGAKILLMDKKMAEWVFDAEFEKLKESKSQVAKLAFQAELKKTAITSENVLGFLKGSEKPEEVLVISAHYDHEGIKNGEIYNGADDDGSGTTSVLEIAQAFAIAAEKGYRPKRSILFITVSGEEKGLLGSKYYTDHPIFPLENTVADLNIDMVGRVDEKHKDNAEYIYLIGSDKLSTELHELSESVNKKFTKLELDYTYNDDNDPNRYYYRSDHYNFAKNDIPVIFYFNGTHEDYHQPTDTVDKINFDKMQKIAELVFLTAWEIANREERIKLD